MIAENIMAVKERMIAACKRAGRKPEDVKLLLATKTVQDQRLQECLDAGANYFGENRVQELIRKQEYLRGKEITWDFIGHLQSKKVKDVVGKVNMIHSVDRMSLVQEVLKRCDRPQKVLLEINTSGEETKSGCQPDDAEELLKVMVTAKQIDVCGFMTIATNTDKEEEVRRCFRLLAELRSRFASLIGKDESSLELSMGMSSDFEWAIEEGATIIRIGSLILGKRE
tara:strand:- start:7627 stop:8304 length:678 start_codon:yes stop_codon:yes gene_type:complete